MKKIIVNLICLKCILTTFCIFLGAEAYGQKVEIEWRQVNGTNFNLTPLLNFRGGRLSDKALDVVEKPKDRYGRELLPGWTYLSGKVVQVHKDGLLVSAHNGGEMFFLRNHPEQNTITDNSLVSGYALHVGRHTYTSTLGAERTVMLYDHGKIIPKPVPVGGGTNAISSSKGAAR